MCVFNKYQVTLYLSPKYTSTVENKGEEYDYNAVGNDNYFRRFCTLDLVITMKVEEDLRNLTNPGVGFSAAKFMTSDDFHNQEDAAIWYDRALV